MRKFITKSGYEALTAHGGAEGLSIILSERPDLVICEAGVLCLLGFEMLAQLRASALGMSQIPFVFLTECGSEPAGRQINADTYVAKPVNFELLGAVISALLSRIARSEPHRLNTKEVSALLWSAHGKTSGEIAKIMHTPERNINFFLDGARRKLGAATRVQAVAMAVSQQIIKL